jgi:two-component system, NarL family, invasion response regulator UvrY
MVRESLCSLIDSWEKCKVIIQAANGRELIEHIHHDTVPDLVILDLSMPEMNGYETAKWLKENYSYIKILMLSMYQSEEAILQMLKCGASGFISKDSCCTQLKGAILEVMKVGYYFGQKTSANLFRQALCPDRKLRNNLTEKEIEFLRYVITDKTYKAIAADMKITQRQLEFIRENLFDHFEVQNRSCLAIKAITSGIVIKT